MAKAYGILSPGTTDTTPPTQPGNFTGSASSATVVNLTWTASTDNIGVAGYQVYRDGAPIGTITGLAFQDAGLSPSTQYSYELRAYDEAGNNSVAAGPTLITTNSNTAPVWSLGNASYNTGDSVSIALDSFCSDADGDTLTYSLASGTLPAGLSLSGTRNELLSGVASTASTYNFTLSASDGITSTPVSLTHTVSTLDTTAPDAPPAPTINTFSSSTVTLGLSNAISAAPSDHAGFEIWRSTDGVTFGKRSGASLITATTWQDTGLSSGTLYYYALKDQDTSGNISDLGTSSSVTTQETGIVSYTVPNVSFNIDGGVQTVDLSSYYTSSIPSGETVSSVELSNASSALPAGVTLDSQTGVLTFDDNNRTASTTSGVVVDVSTSGAITSFTLTDSSTGIDRPVTMGLPFGEGVLASGSGVVVKDPNGNLLPTQWDQLATWRTDGSVLHGAFTFLTNSSGSNSGTYSIVTGGSATGTAVSKTEIAASGFDAVITADIGGTVYSLSAKDLLDGTVTPRKDYTHMTGPLMSSFCLGGPLRTSGGSAHTSVQGHFEIRAYKVNNSIDRVWACCVLENTGADNDLGDVITADVTVTVGSNTIKSKTAFSIYADARYPVRGWWGNDPSIYASLDTSYIQSTALVPSYRNTSVPGSTLDALPSSADWNQTGLSAATPNVGWQRDLAPLPRYCAYYLVTGDQRAWNAMRAVEDQWGWHFWRFGSSLSKPRSEVTGHPIDLATDGRASGIRGYTGSNRFTAERGSSIPSSSQQTDPEHQSAKGYLAYLVTAEMYDLETVLFSGIEAWINERPGAYLGTINGRQWGITGAVRAHAWLFRNITNAGVATPDAHPLKSTMDAAVVNAISENRTRMPAASAGDTGLILTDGTGNAVIYPETETPNPNDAGSTAGSDSVGMAQWMEDWLNWALAFAYARGYGSELDVDGFFDWKMASTLGRFGTTSDWNWAFTSFAIGVRDLGEGQPSGPSAFYTSWSEIFQKNIADRSDYPGRQVSGGPWYKHGGDKATGGSLNQMSSYDTTSTSDTSPLPVLSQLVNLGYPGAQEAWNLLENSSTQAEVPGWENAPEFSVAPL